MLDTRMTDYNPEIGWIKVCIVTTDVDEHDPTVFHNYYDYIMDWPQNVVKMLSLIEFWELISSEDTDLEMLDMLTEALIAEANESDHNWPWYYCAVIRDAKKLFF